MSELWYYAIGEKSVGPLSLPDLTTILSNVSNAKEVLVWRIGFPQWKKAESVPELSPYVIKPPPVPTLSAPVPSNFSTTSPSENYSGDASTASEPSGNRNGELVGIGGWLILVAIGQIFGPLIFVYRESIYYSKVDSYLWNKYPVTFYGEAILFGSFFLLCIYTAYLFFQRSHLFPQYFVWAYVSAFLLSPIDIISSSVTLSAYTGQSIETIAARMMTPEVIGQGIATFIISVIWILYIKKSKRVKNTFVDPMIAQTIHAGIHRARNENQNSQ